MGEQNLKYIYCDKYFAAIALPWLFFDEVCTFQCCDCKWLEDLSIIELSYGFCTWTNKDSWRLVSFYYLPNSASRFQCLFEINNVNLYQGERKSVWDSEGFKITEFEIYDSKLLTYMVVNQGKRKCVRDSERFEITGDYRMLIFNSCTVWLL